MDKIKVAILNPTAISEAEKMMVCAARLTQRGHTVKDLSDFLALYDKEYTEKTAKVKVLQVNGFQSGDEMVEEAKN